MGYIADIATGESGYQPSDDACCWTAADMDSKFYRCGRMPKYPRPQISVNDISA